MGFVKVAFANELGIGKMIGVEAGGKPILIANLNGEYYAIRNVCTHMGCMLSDGTLKGESVQCPCHGSSFNVRTGKVVKGPAEKAEPAFQVKMEANQILVNV